MPFLGAVNMGVEPCYLLFCLEINPSALPFNNKNNKKKKEFFMLLGVFFDRIILRILIKIILEFYLLKST